jgi:F-type H+-transporting ATPase subunit delta
MSPEDRAESYAEAFYEAAVERWLAALEATADKLDQRTELCQQLTATGADLAARQKLLDGILPADIDLPVRNLLYTLIQNGDLGALREIISDLRRRIRRQEAGPVEVEVVSAVALSDEQRQSLLAQLQGQANGGALDVRYRVDPAILGGLIVRLGDKLIDNSVATRLAAMRQTLGVPTAG